jgi:hypothetical protein
VWGNRAAGGPGLRYEWLAWCAAHLGLDRVELGITKDGPVSALSQGSVERDGDAYRLVDRPRTLDLELFRRFRFPLSDRTELAMREEARRLGLAEAMEPTRFCHDPDARGRACGICPPCVGAIEQGLGRRVPWRGHLRHLLPKVWLRLPPAVRRAATEAARQRDRARGTAVGAASRPRP